MKDAHISLRIPAELDQALDERADAEASSKSRIIREAVTRHLDPHPPLPGPDRITPQDLTGRMLAGYWSRLPHLGPSDAEAFANDLECARDALPPARPAWE